MTQFIAHALFAVAALLLLITSVAALPKVKPSPPPLPYEWFQAWTVMTENWINTKGNSTEQWSYGFHTVAKAAPNNKSGGVLCRHGIDLLFPQVPNFTTTVVSNYTSGVEASHQDNYNGTVTDCVNKQLNETTMPFGGAWFLAPSLEMQADMIIAGYAPSGGYNCTIWQWEGSDEHGNRRIIHWYVALGTDVPQILVNQTFYDTPFNGSYVSRVLTTAYVGYEQVNSWPETCEGPNLCGASYCAANAAVGDATLQGALSWACGGYVDCTNISYGGPNYYPNSVVAHASWTFNQYYLANIQDGSSSCNFNGAAFLTVCPTQCTLCNASATADPVKLLNALDWVCANGNIDCTAIQQGGSRFYPNTTQAHADYAFNEYYQGYKCIPPQAAACDFNGTAVVVNC